MIAYYKSATVVLGMAVAFLLVVLPGKVLSSGAVSPTDLLNRQEGDLILRAYHFRNGETLAELRLHYITAGIPIRDGSGKIRNGVLILHGSTNDSSQVLNPSFIGPLIGPGDPLDASKTFLIFPDILGNGKSSKPSDGLHARFPRYGYQDMVDLEHRLITEQLGIARLHLVMGISMGGMHTWMWGEQYPDMMDGLVPFTSLPTKLNGRNLLWRRIISNAIRTDPEWKGGEYTEQPGGFLNIMPVFDMMVSSTARLNDRLNSVADADSYIQGNIATTRQSSDANDILYRFESSFDYDPEPDLNKIKAPLMSLLFADDELNPIGLGVIQREIQKVQKGSVVIIPAGPQSQGHRSQGNATLWREQFSTFVSMLGSSH